MSLGSSKSIEVMAINNEVKIFVSSYSHLINLKFVFIGHSWVHHFLSKNTSFFYKPKKKVDYSVNL